MIGIQLQGVAFGITPHPEMTVLTFHDQQSGITVQIPFDQQAWANFKRQVEADGQVPKIAISRTLPTNGDVQ